MNVNITLFAQIIHFFIAWKIIKTFLLQPTLHVINAEDATSAQQQKRILDMNMRIIALENKKNTEFTLYQQQFRTAMPYLLKEKDLFIFKHTDMSIYAKPVNLASLQEQKDHLEKKLIAKLGSINE